MSETVETRKKKQQWKRIVELILNIDECVIAVGAVDNAGCLVTHGVSHLLSNRTRKLLSKVPADKSYAPAIISSVVNQGEEYFGKPKYIVASYEKLKLLMIPFKKEAAVISLLLTPNTDSRSIAIQVENTLNSAELMNAS